jgi:hypothetical protein
MLPDLRIWLNHFEYHAQHPRRVPPGLADVLTPGERRLIASSIATFQLGEHSDGRTLLTAVRRLAHSRSAPQLERITELFIREEQRHVTLLAEFMRDHAIPLRRRHWTDLLFRLLRRCAGFELSLNVLITAELIGNVYYRALEAVTGCQRLKILCRTLVADELAHIGFFCELLRGLRSQAPAGPRALLGPACKALAAPAHKAFFACAGVVVWCTHRGVLRRSGCTVGSFLRTCLAQYAFHLEQVSPGAALISSK